MMPEANLRDKLAVLLPDLELDAAPDSLMKRGRRRRAARQSVALSQLPTRRAASARNTPTARRRPPTTAPPRRLGASRCPARRESPVPR